jgi:CheY-like chemotaxis protein
MSADEHTHDTTSASGVSNDPASLKGFRILIVEDEVLIAMLAEDTVLSVGAASAGIANTVEMAMARVQLIDFDAVLLDVNLRRSLSYAVASVLQERKVPFLFCTAYHHAHPGFEQVPRLLKPYTADELANALKSILVETKR